MKVVNTVKEMQNMADTWRKEGKTIAFVPTMGYFHEGHLALMRLARERGDVLVVSIFVNPIQFGPSEDYQRYPRDLDRDLRLAESVGVDVVFAPQVEEMYPEGFQTYIEVTEISRPLCGKSRPGHFRGVATVVTKLFNIVKPHIAVFGEKDYQQLLVIRRMVKDLNLDVEIVGHPTVRETDGLAMSSRNVYLSDEERKAALRLNQSLQMARDLLQKGINRAGDIISEVSGYISSDPRVRIDYVEIRDAETLEEIDVIDRPAVLALAAFVGSARLIDNTILRP
ncbi:pantoate--beta-alanine ligase [Thermodesulforhabdus norvegica]|uniref:Pantothenate synthetase n=1 Tax=Thermodesulforhabdus norvegica TaxID=39841 RepID=A0A1I4WFA3_9BACT|nr:pantoate--beta-alanine ligase [Thermodesulforhabdus norvegica]SFN12085.1 pantothenate synthetase [Thermodesulforhabdus norvegica]